MGTRSRCLCLFSVAAYNASYLTSNGKVPIYCKHARAMRDDVMLEAMNENKTVLYTVH